jgi:hypothetical protein
MFRQRRPAPPFLRPATWIGTAVAALALAAPAPAQTWSETGPVAIAGYAGFSFNNYNINGASSVSGAVRTIAVQPGSSDVLYLGTVNGGIWKTTNGSAASPTWTPLTDGLPSLSVGDIQFDPTDGTGNTLVASFRSFSSFGFTGGPRAGVYKTINGGTSWTSISGGSPSMVGQPIGSVLERGSTVLATSVDSIGGLFRSTNGGTSYTQVATIPATGNYTVTGDATGANLFTVSNTNVYKSVDGGATWSSVFSFGLTGINARLALGPGNGATQTIFASVIDSTRNLGGLFRSANGGASWTPLDLTAGGTPLYAGGQGNFHMSLVADPNNANYCYVGGDRTANGQFTAQIFRVNAGTSSGSQASLFVNSYTTDINNTILSVTSDTTDQSTPHADTRSMVFTQNGNLLLGGDGGIFRRTGTNQSGTGGATIAPTTGTWSTMSGNLRISEVNAVAYDRIAHSAMASLQDNGTLMNSPNVTVSTPLASQSWTQYLGGDGGGAAIDSLVSGSSTTATSSFRYTSSQNFGKTSNPNAPSRYKLKFDANNNFLSPGYVPFNPTVTNGGGVVIDTYVTNQGDGYQFVTPQATNSVEGGRFYFGTNKRIFESTNATTQTPPTVTDISPGQANLNGAVTGIAAGGNFLGGTVPNALYVGAGSNVYARSGALAALSAVANLPTYGTTTGNMAVKGLVMDTRDWHNVYVIGPTQVYQGVQNDALSTSVWTNFSGNLPTVAQNVEGNTVLTAIGFVPVNGLPTVGALIAGSDHGAFYSLTSDLTHSWTSFGSSIANVYVTSFTYDSADNVLLAGTLGRGVYTIPNASMAFTPVPEPACCLLAAGLAGFGGWRRRRQPHAGTTVA